MKQTCKRIGGCGIVLLACGLCCTGCIQMDTTAQLPSFETPFLFPLPPGTPIFQSLQLPVIELCGRISMEAILERIREEPFGNLLVGLFQSLVHIQEMTVTQAVMEVLEPQNGTFDGLTEITFFLNGQGMLTSGDDPGINGKTITLLPAATINLVDIIENCPDAPAQLTVAVEGQVPQTPPTRWRNVITVHVKARIGLF